MSEFVQNEEHVDGTVGREVLVRTFAATAEMSDDRTIDVRVVPFDEVIEVADPPEFRAYREQFMPGVFAHQENAANRIYLRAGQGHDSIENGVRKPGLAGVVGHGRSLIGRTDGYFAQFKMHGGAEADTARELIADGVYTGVSAEFYPAKSVRTREGIVQRVKANLESVLLTPIPAYSKSQILAMREEEVTVDAELLPPAPDAELLERISRLGIDLPEEMALLLARAYTEAPWDGSASRFSTAEAYCAASAIDLNAAGGPKTKSACHLPYKEPSGEINVNGVRAALSRIGQGDPQDATPAERATAQAKLEKILNSFNSTSPAS